VQAGDEAKQEQYLTDRAGGGLYVHNTQTGAIYALADDGSRTTLRAEGAPDVQHRDIQRIMRLTDTKYYIDGFCSSAAEEYWEIFDTATGAATSGEQIFQSYDRIFSDGGTGIYATVENGDHYAVAHITEEKTEIVLDKPARPYGWYVSGSCIYYLTTDGNSDFSKFDMETGEDTVMEQNSGITMIVPAGDRVYIQLDADPATGSAPVISCKPDLSDRKEFTVAYPEDITAKNGVCYLMDVCGDSLYFDVLVEEETTPVTDSNFYECKPNCLLYNMSTNTVQTYFSK